MRSRIYIAGPITKGDMMSNIRQAESAFKRLCNAGYAPYCPHWACYGNNISESYVSMSGWMGDQEIKTLIARPSAEAMGITHKEYLEMDFSWVSACRALLRLPGESVGADAEVNFALKVGIPVFTNIESLIVMIPVHMQGEPKC